VSADAHRKIDTQIKMIASLLAIKFPLPYNKIVGYLDRIEVLLRSKIRS
jgi:hypothetical protein